MRKPKQPKPETKESRKEAIARIAAENRAHFEKLDREDKKQSRRQAIAENAAVNHARVLTLERTNEAPPVMYVCPHCNNQCSVSGDLIGADVNCPHCSNVFNATASKPTMVAEPPVMPKSKASGWETTGGIAFLLVVSVGLLCGYFGVGSQNSSSQSKPDVQPPVQNKETKTEMEAPQRKLTASRQAVAAKDGGNAESLAFSNAIALFNRQNYTSALVAFDSFINDYPTSPRVPVVKQRMADIQRIIDAQNAKIVAETHAAERGIADEYTKQRARQLSSPYMGRDGHGVFNYPDTVIVKGLGKTKTEAFKAAKNKVPQGAETMSIEYYPVSLENYCCEISYKP